MHSYGVYVAYTPEHVGHIQICSHTIQNILNKVINRNLDVCEHAYASLSARAWSDQYKLAYTGQMHIAV